LLLVRGAHRRREVGVRLALGASPRHIVRQLLTEAALLWLLGGTLGTGLAVAGIKALSFLPLPTDRPLFVDVGVDARVLTFSIAATLLTGLAFGLVPALTAARMDVVASLKDAGRPLTWRSPLRGALVASQVALCVVLLVGAGLCLRSLANARRIDLGFEPAGVGMASVDLKLHGYDDERSERFWRDLEARLSALAGVEAVGFTNRLPFELNIIRLPAAPSEDEALRLPSVDFAVVDRGYFSAMRVALRQGRAFGPSGMPSSASEVVINETLARRFWPKGDALGRRLAVGGGLLEVVGIAADGRYLTLGEEPTPFLFLPFRGREATGMTVLLRTTNPLAGDRAPYMLRQEIGALDSTLPAHNVKTLREHLAIALLPAGVSAALLGVFAGLALLLASVGLYGLLAHAVAQRTHEIGVRRALGALDRDVILLVVRQGMAPVLVGLGAGTALGLVVSPVLGSVLYGIGAADPAAHAGAVIILVLTAAVACGAPAIGATRVEPMAALRQD
jgi:predicted permease